jgi:putative hemolysin
MVLPESTPLLEAIERFRVQSTRMAVIVDEYGVLLGIVTRTDLLEAIAGDLPDVGEEPEVLEELDGTYVMAGRMPGEEAFIRLNIVNSPKGDVHTVAGFAIAVLGRIPCVDDTFCWEGHRFQIVDMDGPRLKKTRVDKGAGCVPAVTENSRENRIRRRR